MLVRKQFRIMQMRALQRRRCSLSSIIGNFTEMFIANKWLHDEIHGQSIDLDVIYSRAKRKSSSFCIVWSCQIHDHDRAFVQLSEHNLRTILVLKSDVEIFASAESS